MRPSHRLSAWVALTRDQERITCFAQISNRIALMGCVCGVRDPVVDHLSAEITETANGNKHNHSKHMRRSTVRGSIDACDPRLIPSRSFLRLLRHC